MNKGKDLKTYSTVNKCINVVLSILKYLALIACVISSAVTLFLCIMFVMKGSNITAEALYEAIIWLTDFKEQEIVNFVQEIGTVKVTIAFIAYGATIAISSGLLRAIFCKFKELFNLLISGNGFDQSSVEVINDCIPLTIIYAMVQPIILYIIVNVIGIFNYDDVSVHGITYVLIAYIAKLFIDEGHKMYEKNIKISKEVSDIKAYESELKISALNKQIQAKKEEKKQPKKKIVKKDSSKSEKKTSKKTTTK